MIPFKSTQDALRELSHDSIAQLIGASHDITLLLNAEGIIVDIAFGAERPLDRIAGDWIGKSWLETVTTESRIKIERLLADADKPAPELRWRQVNHPTGPGADVPILYLAVRAGDSDLTLAIGKDLRAISDMQQQLLDMQHSIESEYTRLQQAESRYRVLLQTTREAIVIVDPANGRIVEVNPAAAELIDEKAARLIGKRLQVLLDPEKLSSLESMFGSVIATGKEHRADVVLASTQQQLRVSGVSLRRESSRLLMLRLSVADESPASMRSADELMLLALVDNTPDACVVTDPSGQIIAANAAFADLCQVSSPAQIKEQPIDQWVGRPGVDVNVLRKNLQQRRHIRQFPTIVNAEFGSPIDVELSAAAFEANDETRFGFVMRRSMRQPDPVRLLDERGGTPRSVEQMTELVGRVPLKELIRETTDILEKLCIEAALKTTADNRASAAEMLGLSRQSLYVKLRRHGLAGDDTDKEK